MAAEPNGPSAEVQRALRLTAEIVGRYGPRLAGSEACHQAALKLAEELGRSCGSVKTEAFSHHPRAFLGHLRITAALFLMSALALHLGLLLPTVAFALCGHAVSLLEFGFYQEAVDRLYPRKNGLNVVARLDPRGTPVQQVILSAHHDSAYEFWYLAHLPWLYLLLVFTSTVVNAAVPALVLAHWIAVALGHGFLTPASLQSMAILLVAFNAPFFFFLTNRGTPGAGDNLIASSMLTCLADHFRGDQTGAPLLERTRLLFVSFDAEEAGLRGSRAFARAHAEELKALPTYALNLESLFDVNSLRCLVSDINGSVRLSQAMARQCARVGRKLGYKVGLAPMLYGYGATDAAELAKAGVAATTLIGLNPNFAGGKVTYHTQRDLVEGLQPAAIQAGLDIAKAFVLERETLCERGTEAGSS